MRHPKAFPLDRLLAAEAFVLVACLALLVPTQNDTWWHLAAGRDMFASHRVALSESWSHTAAGAPWANYEWLTQALFYALYRAGGLPLLTLAAAAAVVGAYAITWRSMRGPRDARALLLIAAASNSTLVWAVRPQVLTLCLVALTISLVLARRWAWTFPLFVLWANLHGGVALGGLVLVASLLAAAAVERRLVPTILATGVASALAGCLTPLGWRYWIEIVVSLGRSASNRVAEWQPPGVEGPHLVFWAALVALPIVAALHRRRLREFDTAMLVTASLLCGLLAARSQRNVPVFLLLALPAFTRLLWGDGDGRAEALPHNSVEPWRGRLHLAILAATVFAGAALVGVAWTRHPVALGWTPMSPAAADAIRACQPPMYNPYNEGGYLAWFVPGQPVFLDSRQDPYPVSLVQAHLRAEQQQDYLPLFRQYGIRCAVFPSSSSGPSTLTRLGWHERFRDPRWVVLDTP